MPSSSRVLVLALAGLSFEFTFYLYCRTFSRWGMKFTLVGVLVEVHDGDGLGVDIHTVGDEVYVGDGLGVDIHTVGDEVHVGEGLVVDIHAVG